MAFDANALAPVPNERVELGLRRLGRDSVFQSANHIEEVAATVLTIGRIEAERHPDFGAVVHDIGARRHDADDFTAQAIDLDGLSNHRSSAKCALPQLVRQNRYARRKRCWLPLRRRRTTHVGFSRGEQAPLRGLDAKRVEQMLVNRCRTHPQRPVAGSKVHFTRRIGAYGRKRSVDLPELHIFRRRYPELGKSERRKLRCQIHQLLWPRITERPQDDAVHDREDGGVGADSQRQRQAGRPP